MSRRSFFATVLSFAAMASTDLLTSGATANETPKAAAGSTLVALDEADDAWLHEHCAYRGLVTGGTHFPAPGTVFELVHEWNGIPTAKQFRCVEQPPFWKTTWVGASEADLACTDAKDTGTCTPPLSGARAAQQRSPDPASTPIAPSDVPSSDVPSSAPTSPGSPVTDVKRPIAPPPKSGTSTLGWVLAGTGITALVGAGIAGGLVLDAKATTETHCTAVMTCNPQGLAAADRGQTLGLVATVAFGIGAAALAGGVLLLVLDKPKETQVGLSARPTTHGAALSLEGRF